MPLFWDKINSVELILLSWKVRIIDDSLLGAWSFIFLSKFLLFGHCGFLFGFQSWIIDLRLFFLTIHAEQHIAHIVPTAKLFPEFTVVGLTWLEFMFVVNLVFVDAVILLVLLLLIVIVILHFEFIK
jgi:hypothetical protein